MALKSEKEEDSDFIRPTKTFSKLMRNISSNLHENHYCFGCLHSFRCKPTWEKHTQRRKEHDFCKVKLPKKGKNIKKYRFGTKTSRMNDTIYLDFECLLINQDVSLNNPPNSHTTNISQHIPSGYSISTLRNHNESSNVKYCGGKDFIQKLCDDLRDIACEIFEDEETKKLSLSPSQEKQHGNAEKCYICNKFFNNDEDSKYYKSYKKEKYHCCYTGKYVGAAHPSCINNYKIKKWNSCCNS